jgi:hypothetical protein
MKEFQFSKTYFNTFLFDDLESNIRIVVKEKPSFEITEEEYSLRIETHHEEEQYIHRKYAIEHHPQQDKHNFPHLQFKFHTEEVGTFWLHLILQNSEEYQKAILGFIYKIKCVLSDLEKFRTGITEEIMILDEVNKLEKEGEFLSLKISESIAHSQIEFDDNGYARDKLQKLNKNPLLLDFLGKDNLSNMILNYKKKPK